MPSGTRVLAVVLEHNDDTARRAATVVAAMHASRFFLGCF